MGEDHVDEINEGPPRVAYSAQEIVGTWSRDTGIAISNDAAARDATAATERPPPLPAPTRFQVLRELGRGGMGQVDEVFDAFLGRSVARKTVLPGGGLLQSTLLVSEAQTCAQLEHPSIVPVYDFAPSDDGLPQYTMRLVRGRTLREVLDQREPSGMFSTLARKLGVLRQVCLAVAYAHERGVVHRDLKPDNVICGGFGEVYILDWGIAHLLEGSDVKRARHDDVQAGSPGYMAPEQVLGMKITPATDVFALGAMLYEMVTGERAFEDRDVPSIIRRCSVGLDAPPSSKNAKAPRAFDSLIARCLDGEAACRPSALDVAAAIDSFIDGERVRAERDAEANAFTDDGEGARSDFEELSRRADALADQVEDAMDAVPAWQSFAEKTQLWGERARVAELRRQAARSLARAQAAFIRALGRVQDHERARQGLASLHYRLFEVAEREGDVEAMTQQLDLARSYDAGDLALELANEGVLIVDAQSEVTVSIHRFDADGPRMVPRRLGEIRTGSRTLLEAGSYLVIAREDSSRPVRYPVKIERAKRHHLRLRISRTDEVPETMVLIPGGPCLLARNAKATRLTPRSLPDFAIGRFPVTWREYALFLDDLDPAERARRLVVGEQAFIEHVDGSWKLTDYAVEGPARSRIPQGRELDLPASQISWFDAVAYTRWMRQRTGLPYRLPTELEWEKALRGADGRRFSMGDHLDPCLAKLRESRPEPAQVEVIGSFETDESPFGVRDLTGGVGDWTATLVGDEGAPSEAESDADTRQAVWRGGCYGTTALFPHAMRFTDRLSARLGWVGFRLALSLDERDSSDLTVEPMRRR